jgi:glycosyltransferase involved in cell wall biosynthesis
MGLVLFHPAPNYMDAQPHKLFDYMAAGIPIIASDFPLWREIIGAAGCGIVVDPLKPQEIAKAMQWLWEHPVEAKKMGLRGREAATSRYNWDHEGQKLVSLYARLAH